MRSSRNVTGLVSYRCFSRSKYENWELPCKSLEEEIKIFLRVNIANTLEDAKLITLGRLFTLGNIIHIC